jgi:hypothetical protein
MRTRQNVGTHTRIPTPIGRAKLEEMRQSAHRFDEGRAKRYRPRDDFAKTAVLVSTADPLAETVIDTPFGRQRFIGSFYIVAANDASYGAARREFEASHRAVGPNRWVKRSPVLAYRTAEACLVETVIGDHVEGHVTARPGDWIVRQHTGEMMVMNDGAFVERYVDERSAGAATT